MVNLNKDCERTSNYDIELGSSNIVERAIPRIVILRHMRSRPLIWEYVVGWALAGIHVLRFKGHRRLRGCR
jgi:hypothetical protein